MRRSVYLLLGFLSLFLSVAQSDSISTVYVSIGPIPNVSPSSSGYNSNAQTGVQNGGTTTGPAGPKQFTTVNAATWANLNEDTDFNNWNSIANPSGAYAGEFGNAVFYSVVLRADAGVNGIALDDISYVESSTDASNHFTKTCSFGNALCGDTNYSSSAVGILANGTQVPNGTAGTTDVNEIVLTGIYLDFNVTGQYTGSPQQQLNQAVSYENSQFGNDTIQTCFTDFTDGLSNCGSLNVSPTDATATPEPASLALLGLGVAFGVALRYRGLKDASS